MADVVQVPTWVSRVHVGALEFIQVWLAPQVPDLRSSDAGSNQVMSYRERLVTMTVMAVVTVLAMAGVWWLVGWLPLVFAAPFSAYGFYLMFTGHRGLSVGERRMRR